MKDELRFTKYLHVTTSICTAPAMSNMPILSLNHLVPATVMTIMESTATAHRTYLKAGSSLLDLGGGDSAFLLLKSFWKSVGGIVYPNKSVQTVRLKYKS